MNNTIREIRVFTTDSEFVVDKIILNTEQFSILKEAIDNSGDPRVVYVYQIELQKCLDAKINLPEKYLNDSFEFFLHSYKVQD